jgi:hypothetical protein
MATHDSTGLQNPMPRSPGDRLAGQPAPKHVSAASDEIPYLARDKQRWTTPLRVSSVQGLKPGTVLPPAAIQPIVGHYVR